MWLIVRDYWPVLLALGYITMLAGGLFVWLAVLLRRQLREERRAGILRGLDGQIFYIPGGPNRPAYFRR